MLFGKLRDSRCTLVPLIFIQVYLVGAAAFLGTRAADLLTRAESDLLTRAESELLTRAESDLLTRAESDLLTRAKDLELHPACSLRNAAHLITF
jgi:hypothetical protein